MSQLLPSFIKSLQDCEMIYAYLSAILHLTDIQFEPDQETDGVFITDEYPLHVCRYFLYD